MVEELVITDEFLESIEPKFWWIMEPIMGVFGWDRSLAAFLNEKTANTMMGIASVVEPNAVLKYGIKSELLEDCSVDGKLPQSAEEIWYVEGLKYSMKNEIEELHPIVSYSEPIR
jgi:hypothetical protein